MIETRIISVQELSNFGSVNNLNEQVKSLISQQKTTWKIAAENYKTLNSTQIHTFNFDYFKITTQFNAKRIRSSAAKTDAKSIAARPCFLCLNNLPPEQKGLLFQNEYLILTNPYPIFPKHLTISKLEHIPQQILPHFSDLLELSKTLPDFTVFYNGPKCGASAPDHFHFQAGNYDFLPVVKEFITLEKQHSETLFQNKTSKIIAVENYLRRIVALVSSDKDQLQEQFKFIYNFLNDQSGNEPMMNILCNFIEDKFRVIIFPREIQHPSHFHKVGEKRIVVGPAAVELGGVLVLPRNEDFNKITKKEIAEIYEEVTICKNSFDKLCSALKKY